MRTQFADTRVGLVVQAHLRTVIARSDVLVRIIAEVLQLASERRFPLRRGKPTGAASHSRGTMPRPPSCSSVAQDPARAYPRIRALYSPGGTPRARRKARLKVCGEA